MTEEDIRWFTGVVPVFPILLSIVAVLCFAGYFWLRHKYPDKIE